ncbi:MAG: DnaJ C-terminal domain-containing protein [Candidatus Roizmanbacteria bacterium]
MAKDHYETLGVSKNATDQEIKAAYRKLAMQWHPDRNKEEGSEKKFKEINQAFETLSNPQKKQTYDQFGADGPASQPRGNGGGYQSGPFQYTYSTSGNPFGGFSQDDSSDPFDIFEQFFGGMGGRQSQKRKSLYQLSITFKEAYSGVEKTVQIEGAKKTIKIPAGVDTNNRIAFADFDVIIQVSGDSHFKREGQDVYGEISIPLTTALLGGKIDVATISGKTVTVKIKPGTKHGSALRLKGKGFPYVRQSGHGDHYIIFNMGYPEHLTEKQKSIIKDLAKEGL